METVFTPEVRPALSMEDEAVPNKVK